LASSSALASNAASTLIFSWLTLTMRKPSVCEPVGWFLVRRKRCRIASSVRPRRRRRFVTGGQGLFLSKLIEGDDLRRPSDASGGGRRPGAGAGGLPSLRRIGRANCSRYWTLGS
jgi:hypothetical protein